MKLSYEEIIELEKNFYHIDDIAFVDQVRAEVCRHLRDLFNSYGNFKEAAFDAHRSYRKGMNEAKLPWQKECGRIHEFLFDDAGNLRTLVAEQLPIVIDAAGFGWKSKAVHLHYANMHGEQTSGSYPATWMDK